MNKKNRRKNERVPFQTSASLCYADVVYENMDVLDLSMRGAFVAGVSGMKVSDQCRIELFLSGASSSLRLEMLGEVVRVSNEGVGLHFIELDPDTFFHLKNIVYYNSEDPDHLEDQLFEDIPDGSFE